MEKKAWFIVFEGIDGSGKSTQIQALHQHMRHLGLEAVLTREPGGTKIGEEIRKTLLDRSNVTMDAMTEMLLYAASRAQHVKEHIMPSLQKGISVISDRYVLSSYVYQGCARGIDLDIVKRVNRYATNGLTPHMTFFIDIHNQEALKRRKNRCAEDRLELEDDAFFEKLCNGYRSLLAHIPNAITVNGMQSEEEVTHELIAKLHERIGG